jgi:putative SOS response-associated peptidase YedK
VNWQVFAFLTTTPNAVVKPVHSKAMPVLLTEKTADQWMEGTPEEAFALGKPCPNERTVIVPAPKKAA